MPRGLACTAVDGFVADAHGLIIGEVETQPTGDLFRAPRRGPSSVLPTPVSATLPGHDRPADRRPVRGDDRTGQPLLHVTAQRCVDRQLGRLRTAGGSIGVPWRGCGAVFQTATARGGAARGRSWTALAPAGGRSRERRALERARSRSPPAPQTTDSALTAASTTARDVTVACRPPPGTTVPLRLATLRRQPRRPRSNTPPRSPPRTAGDPHAVPPWAGLATATRFARTDPNAAFECSSQPPPARCCDDRLNPPASGSYGDCSRSPTGGSSAPA